MRFDLKRHQAQVEKYNSGVRFEGKTTTIAALIMEGGMAHVSSSKGFYKVAVVVDGLADFQLYKRIFASLLLEDDDYFRSHYRDMFANVRNFEVDLHGYENSGDILVKVKFYLLDFFDKNQIRGRRFDNFFVDVVFDRNENLPNIIQLLEMSTIPQQVQ